MCLRDLTARFTCPCCVTSEPCLHFSGPWLWDSLAWSPIGLMCGVCEGMCVGCLAERPAPVLNKRWVLFLFSFWFSIALVGVRSMVALNTLCSPGYSQRSSCLSLLSTAMTELRNGVSDLIWPLEEPSWHPKLVEGRGSGLCSPWDGN